MISCQPSTALIQSSDDITRNESDKGIALNMRTRQMSRQMADQILEPIWNRRLRGYPYKDAEFSV